MIEYCQADVEWFERELADVSRARVGRRLEDVISHRDCVELARASDRITVREAELPKQLVHLDVAAQQERDQAKCAAIRNANQAKYDRSQRVGSILGWAIASLGFLACLMAAWMKWGK